MIEWMWVRVPAAFVVDAGLALLCGSLLSERWLRQVDANAGAVEDHAFGARLLAAMLFLGCILQLLVLVAGFSGRADPFAVMAMAPEVCQTHAGAVLLALAVAVGVLSLVTWMRAGSIRNVACWALVLSCLGLHGATGHAAVDGIFSLTQGLQWIHVLGMALWSGGVMVAGLLILPELSRRSPFIAVRAYLLQLSRVSTWSVGAVALSGTLKGYRATEGSLPLLRTSHWGQILLVKVTVVAVTIFLGGANRWLLTDGERWSKRRMKRVAWMLRAESVCMVAVLLLSAWLANSIPPLD